MRGTAGGSWMVSQPMGQAEPQLVKYCRFGSGHRS